MNLEQLCEQMHTGVKVDGEINPQQPRMYYWRCWLGDEFTTVSTTQSDDSRQITGSGVTLMEGLDDLVVSIRGKTLWIFRKDEPPVAFPVPDNLTV